jgi:hypothetical protein
MPQKHPAGEHRLLRRHVRSPPTGQTPLRESSGRRRGEIIESGHPIDNHASPVSPYEEEIEACIGRIVDEAVSQDAYAHPRDPARGTSGPETSTED